MRNRLGVPYAQDSDDDGIPRGGIVDDRRRAARAARRRRRSCAIQAGIPAGAGRATPDGEATGEFHPAEVHLREAEDGLPQAERPEADRPEELQEEFPEAGGGAEATDEGELQ